MRFTSRHHDGRNAAAALRAAARRTLAALLTAISCVAAGIAVANVATIGSADGGSVPGAIAALAVAIIAGTHAYRARVERAGECGPRDRTTAWRNPAAPLERR